jgi:integrase
MSDYHLFRKPRLKNGKTVHRWYYYFVVNGKQIQKSCKRCSTKAQAEAYLKKLPNLSGKNAILVKTIAESMYIPNSDHMKRRIQLGKPLDSHTMQDARLKIDLILKEWGERTIESLTVEEVGNYLFAIERSGSWKRAFLNNLREIYREAQWHKCSVPIPLFPAFARKVKKADIFTTEELSKLLVPENFPTEEVYLFMLCLLSGGLRLGEGIGMRAKQVLFERKALVIDGFQKRDNTRAPYNKKGSEEHPKARIVPLPVMTINKLREHIDKNGYQDEEYVFRACKDRTQPINHYYIEDSLRSAIAKAGINRAGRKLVVHSFRYTYVTRMRRELPAEIVMKLVGHVSEEQTDYYNKRELDYTLKQLTGADAAAANLFS